MALRLVAEDWFKKAIAAELGFAEESHFCHAYKKFYGASPRATVSVYPNRRMSRLVGRIFLKDRLLVTRIDVGIKNISRG